ncbi:MAG: type II toxin-antitoxin system RelE/ParE family toxin [Gammaproteobacteria bacterium]|nr:MAG: type II toxin-antitoxin system RelE/ParE family toxin [Gammaproteobacteria bacterium]
MKHRLFVESTLFTNLVANYLHDDEYAALQQHLLEQPTAGPVIRNSGGVRKLRWASRGKGKRGGVRVIYYVHDKASFWMLTIYRKGEVDSIPGPIFRQIKEVMENG